MLRPVEPDGCDVENGSTAKFRPSGARDLGIIGLRPSVSCFVYKFRVEGCGFLKRLHSKGDEGTQQLRALRGLHPKSLQHDGLCV